MEFAFDPLHVLIMMAQTGTCQGERAIWTVVEILVIVEIRVIVETLT